MRAEVEKAVELLHSGRPDGLEQALALLQNTVFSFSMKVCGQREDAEDTMQDVLLKTVPYLPKFESPKALVVWLYKVAKNRCLMSRRRSKFAPKETLSLDDLMPDAAELERLSELTDTSQPSPEHAVLRAETAKHLQQAVLKLPPEYRLILVLHDMEELDSDEISKITGLRPGTVRVRLHRARLFVRKELAKAAEEVKSGGKKPSKSAQPRRRKVKAAAGATQRTDGSRSRSCKQMFAALSDYLDGALDDSLCDELERHMAGCKPCEAFLNTLERTVEQAHQHPAVRPDPRTAAALRQKLMTEYRQALATRR